MRLLAVEKGSSMPRACADTPDVGIKKGSPKKKSHSLPGAECGMIIRHNRVMSVRSLVPPSA
jgi:hypothetical protein